MNIKTGKALDLSGAILFALAGIIFLFFGFGVFSLGCFFAIAGFLLSYFEWQRRQSFEDKGKIDASDRRFEWWTIALLAALALWCFIFAIWNVLT